MGEKYIPVVIVITLQRIITLQRKTCVNSYIPPRNSLSYESLPPSCFRKISAVLGRLKWPEFLAMPLDRKLLRFFWKGQRFEFTCLIFGYSLAPRVFTKILKLFAATWRSKGIRISICIDDILIIASSAKQAATLLPLSETP